VLVNIRELWIVGLLSIALLVSACGGGGEGAIVVVDAEYDPAGAFDADAPVSETDSVAQIFTVLATGKFERFWIELTQGSALESGFIRITVRPTIAGLPDPSPASSIINPIDVDTDDLPTAGIEQFTVFDVGNDPGRQVTAGDELAIVVEFLSRDTGTIGNPIARLLGTDGTLGDPFAGGAGAEDSGGGFALNPSMDDYIFRTFVLQ